MTDFQMIINKATEAANLAGDEWIKEHTRPAFNVMDGDRCAGQMLDVCGFAGVSIKDKRTAFAKWIKKSNIYPYSFINHKYRGRQELGLNTACASAAYKVLTDSGVTGIDFYSRID